MAREPNAPMTVRARARAELTSEILARARAQLGDVGAGALSLRAVARDLGMASSAIYRYFESRDALLTALIVESFDDIGQVAEEAVATARSTGFEARWAGLSSAIRRWAVDRPHDYALVYGSPVPGYRAPDDTVTPAGRVSLAMLGIVADGVSAGEIDTTPTTPVPAPMQADLGTLRSLAEVEVPDEILARALLAWTAMFGTISYELFGHFNRVIADGDAFFGHEMGRLGAFVARGSAP